MTTEGRGSRPLIKRIPVAPIASLGGAAALVGVPAVVGFVETIPFHLTTTTGELALGVLGGAAVTAVTESGFRSAPILNRHTAVGMVGTVASVAGIAAVADSLSGIQVGGDSAFVGVAALIGGAFVTVMTGGPASETGESRALWLRRVGVAAASAGGAGALAIGFAAVTKTTPPDMGLIDGLAAVGLGASAVPTLGSLLFARRARQCAVRSAAQLGE